MSITLRKYVDIVSGVGGAAAVAARDLIGRLFTSSPLLPTGSFVEMTTAEDVAAYFGTNSPEYARAVFYFGWISPRISRARRISFARFTAVSVAPTITGASAQRSLAALQSITTGSLTLTLGGVTATLSPLDLSTATSFADVATLLQSTIREDEGSQFTSATVTYDAVNSRFNLTGGISGSGDVSVTAGDENDVSGLIGWNVGARFSDGAAAQDVRDAVIASTNASDNFGSFAFVDALTLDQYVDLAEWNAAENIKYQFMVPVAPADAIEYAGSLLPYAGTALTLAPNPAQFPELIPMIQLAAVDYLQREAVTNFMFKQFAVTPSVTDTPTSDEYDAIRVNYMGRTQTAGRTLDFYQRGQLMGPSTAPLDMNVYGNEQWLKDDAAVAIMSLFMGLGRLSGNNRGAGYVISALQQTVDRALRNGVISVDKTLNNLQRVYVTELSGDELAWRQVENLGYWLSAEVVSFVNTSGATEYKILYTLIYSKDDAIRKVEGTHALI